MAMTKAEVREAFREVMAADYADVPKREEIDHIFSPEFYARMDALIAEQKRGAWRMMPRQCKRVLVVAAILAATLMLVACTPGLRQAVERLVVTIYETFVEFSIDVTENGLRTEIETVYDIDLLPEGFEMVSQERSDPYRVKTLYKSRNNEKIVVIQTVSDNSIVRADSEKREFYSKTISEAEILFSTEGVIRTATAFSNGYFFTIRYIGKVDQRDFEIIVASLIGTD